MKYKFLDHTADIKVKVYGKTINEIYENSALAVSNFLSRNKVVNKKLTKKINITGKNKEELLYKFIDEIIYLLDAKNFLIASAKITKSDKGINAELYGDNSKEYKHDQIKAATYHEMKFQRSKAGWEADFIFDV